MVLYVTEKSVANVQDMLIYAPFPNLVSYAKILNLSTLSSKQKRRYWTIIYS